MQQQLMMQLPTASGQQVRDLPGVSAAHPVPLGMMPGSIGRASSSSSSGMVWVQRQTLGMHPRLGSSSSRGGRHPLMPAANTTPHQILLLQGHLVTCAPLVLSSSHMSTTLAVKLKAHRSVVPHHPCWCMHTLMVLQGRVQGQQAGPCSTPAAATAAALPA